MWDRVRQIKWHVCRALVLSVLGSSLHAQQEIPTTLPKPLSLRGEENYRPLANDSLRRATPGGRLKLIPLSRDRSKYAVWALDLRGQYEHFTNEAWGEANVEREDFYLTRVQLHLGLQLAPRWRVYTTLKSGIVYSRENEPRPPDVDSLAVHQAFVEYRSPLTNGSLTVRLGRQELSYGISRLVSLRESPNVRQSFDALRIIWSRPNWQWDALAASFISIKPGLFDDSWARSYLSGIYGQYKPGAQRPNWDMYLFWSLRERKQYATGVGRDDRIVLGTRLASYSRSLHYDLEGTLQSGRFASQTVWAYSLSGLVQYRWLSTKLQPQVGFKANVFSGDRSGGSFGTFDPLYPKGAYFGLAALIGPANLLDVHPSIAVSPGPLQLSFDWDFFWRYSLTDGVYGPPGALERTANASLARFIGHQPGIDADYELNDNLTLTLEANFFAVGRFLQESGEGRNITHWVFRVTYQW